MPIGIGVSLEGFFYRLRSGDIFYAKGVTHPEGYAVAYPRYVVDLAGDRVDRSGVRYRRLGTLEEEYSYASSRYSGYVRLDRFYCREVVLVPLSDIEHIYNPIQRARELLESTPEDSVLADVRNMVLDLVEATGVKDIGVSGSVLVGLHREDSDIDIVVYGIDNSRRVYRYLSEVVDKDPRYRRYSADDVLGLYLRRSAETPIPFDQVLKQESRRVLEGFFGRREYFVRLLKYPWEEPSYGSYVCSKLGKAVLRLRVLDASEAMLTPCRYAVEVVEHVDGVRADVVEVYSLRGRFAEVAREGDIVIARGTVELIETLSGEMYYRLYLGDRDDYLVLES
uniref:Polymerase nucleotidyl transferase domain-containing protein n=1 Tax=Ignisphaera aggregans TaxID=334771 RepID=A0A7C2VGU8_9CREN